VETTNAVLQVSDGERKLPGILAIGMRTREHQLHLPHQAGIS
jgi:hypothetical protein